MKSKITMKYGYLWVTAFLFLLSLIGHFVFGWYAFVDDQKAHGLSIEPGSYFVQMLRDMLENWQSEFLQLIWQVAGLSFLYFLGSPQSKEGSDRMEEKMDLVLKSVSKERGDAWIRGLDKKYPRQ